MAFPNDGKKFEPGESGNPNGRKKKWQTELLKDYGYSKSEINDCYMLLLDSTLKELEAIRDNEAMDILARKTAKALIKEWEKGSLWNQEILITRRHGQPKQEIEAEFRTTIIKAVLNKKEPDAGDGQAPG